MKPTTAVILSISPQTQPARKLRKTASLALHQRSLYGRSRRNNTGKELDSETGLYYYGARYLDPRVSRWISGDPALGEYVPQAPVNDEARRRNGNLPGMGGVFNCVNLHVYHYTGNNPVRYVDPDGYQNIPSFGDYFNILADNIPSINLFRIINSALSGNKSAQAQVGYLWQQAGREILTNVSSRSSQATLVFLTTGAPEAAAVASGVGYIANGLLLLDDFLSENYESAFLDSSTLIAGVILNKGIGRGVERIAEKGIKISVGKNGRYYSLDRRGAMGSRDAIRLLIAADIADSSFGDLAPEVAEQLLNKAMEAYDKLQE